MPLPYPLNEDVAGWAAAIGVGLAAAWKLYFRSRRDQREDRQEGMQQSGYELIVEQLRGEIQRLSEVNDMLADKLDACNARRWELETDVAALKIDNERLRNSAASDGMG